MDAEETLRREFGEDMLPARPGHSQENSDGCWAVWDDQVQTFTLQWGPAAGAWAHGALMAEEMDAALLALEAIRAGDVGRLRDAEFLTRSMSRVRRLRMRLEAIEEELLLAARDKEPTGKSTLTWDAVGGELRQHPTSVRERWIRSTSGQYAEFRDWLTQEITGRGDPAPGAEHFTEVYGPPEQPDMVFAGCRCGWTSEPMRNTVATALAGKAHVAEHTGTTE